MVWITINDVFLDLTTKVWSQIVGGIMSSINAFVGASSDSMYTGDMNDYTIGTESGSYSSLGNKCLCGYQRSIESHYVSMRRYLTRSIYASLMFCNLLAPALLQMSFVDR